MQSVLPIKDKATDIKPLQCGVPEQQLSCDDKAPVGQSDLFVSVVLTGWLRMCANRLIPIGIKRRCVFKQLTKQNYQISKRTIAISKCFEFVYEPSSRNSDNGS